MVKKEKQNIQNTLQRIEELEKSLEEKNKTLAEKEAAYNAHNTKYSELEQKYNELMAAAKLIAADFDNFRKRISTEQEKEKRMATKEVVVQLIPLLDQFSLCLDNSSHHEEFAKAISLLYNQLHNTLESIGLKEIPALNQAFDPKLHEALMFVSSDKEDNLVVEEVQKGYFLHDTIIRASKVKVSRKEVSP